MLKKYFFAVLFSVSISLIAQDVNVKKNTIFVDGKQVAKIEKEKRVYNISDLEGNFLFSIENLNRTIGGNPVDIMSFRITGKNGNVREIEATNKSFTLSNEKFITRNLVVGPIGALSSKGIDKALINEFLSHSDTSISNHIDEQYKIINDNHNKEDEVAKNAKLSIEPNGDIFEGNIKIGKIVEKSSNGGFITYIVSNTKGMVVAETKTSGVHSNILKGYELKTFDNKIFVVNAIKSGSTINQNPLAERIVKKLYANDYTLKNTEQKRIELEQKQQEEYIKTYKNAESQSLNIVDIRGYILDKKGEKIEGIINIPFENIEEKISSRLGGIKDLTNYGGNVLVKDNNGKTKTYKAKDGVIVYVGDRIFIGSKGINDFSLNNSSGSQLSILGESQFFEVNYENAVGYVVHHPKNPQYPYIRFKKSNEAFYLGTKGMFKDKSESKLEKQFNDALKCKSLKYQDYDLNSKEGLINLLNDYSSKCN